MSQTLELKPSGRIFGGLAADLKRKMPFYRTDFKDGLNSKVAGTTLFLYFAVLANAIAFGALTGVLTNGQIGIAEMLVVTALGGGIFALFSGQPLTIIGGTGPITIFTGILYAACIQMALPFLPVYAWVGIWAGLMLLICASTDASCLMRYFTRFTDEIFVVLISVIFIFEAIKNIHETFVSPEFPLPSAFLTVILSLGTFMLARGLKRTVDTPFLTRRFREFLSDFGPTIAIAAMTIVALSFSEVKLERPTVPDKLAPTMDRTWLVNLFDVPAWVIAATIIPGIMAGILLFLDQNITTRLVNSKDYRLRKGGGYHLDIAVVGLIVLVGSFFALPWIVAATVHSINHVKSLSETEIVELDGRRQELVLGVNENRVSNLAIHLLMGASLFLLDAIRVIPMPVLFGLFLYMGVTSLVGNRFFERLTLWITDPKLYPDNHFTRFVSPRTLNTFTVIQLLCLVALWVLKSSRLGILFPLMIAGLVPFRMFLRRFFPGAEFDLLVAEDPEDIVEDRLEARKIVAVPSPAPP